MNKKWKFVLLIALILVTSSLFIRGTRRASAMSEPVIDWVSHTEYWSSTGPGSSEVASTIVRITDSAGNPYPVQNCNATILYPNKTAYLSNQPLAISAIAGNWYRTDAVPSVEGTYEQQVKCRYSNTKYITTSQSFHVNPALNFIKTVDADVLAASTKLTDVNATVSATVAATGQQVTAHVSQRSTDLTNLMNQIGSSLSTQLGASDAKLEGINATVTAKIGDSTRELKVELGSINSTLSDYMTLQLSAAKESIINTLRADVANIQLTANQAYSNTQWLVTNAMNSADKTVITSKLDTVTSDINALERFCNSTQTNESRLCLDVADLKVAVGNIHTEQQAHYNALAEINTTSRSTWSLLSGDVLDKVNSIVDGVGTISQLAQQTNQTLADMKEDSDIRINVIS